MTKIAIDFIKAVFGPSTSSPVHFCSLGNERDGVHPFRKLDTREVKDIEAFIAKWDGPDRGLFYSAGTLKPGSKARNKIQVDEIAFLFADIDLKDIEDSLEDVERKLKTLKYPPSIMVRSGNGVHGIWMLTEVITNPAGALGEMDRIEADLKLLADLVGGDHSVCEIARLLRLPGTHNTKRGENKEVIVSHPVDLFDITGKTQLKLYHLEDLEEWLAETSPVILRKERERGRTVSEMSGESKPSVDVEKRLDAMGYMMGGDAAVHTTQLAVTGSMLNAGRTIEETVSLVLAATKAAAGDYGKRWNWQKEEKTIRGMCDTWLKKYTPIAETRAKEQASEVPTKKATAAAPGRVETVEQAKAAAKGEPKPKKPKDTNGEKTQFERIGDAILGVLHESGRRLLFLPKQNWMYADGIWTIAEDIGAWINTEVQAAADQFGISANLKLVNETRNWILRQKHLRRESVDWDSHGLIPTRNGLIDPRTMEVTEIVPEHYVTWRIETKYDPEAKCPWWLQMLEDCFSDRHPDERAQIIGVIQEVLGAGLVDNKPRELSKALIFQGGSNFGKSGLLEVLGGFFGSEQNATPIESLEGPHGMMGFLKRRPWVLHEAFDQRKWHFSSAVKAIVTGEPISVNVKNGPMLSVRITSPIFWGTNHPPQFKEATKAIVNRLIVILCKREFFPDELVGTAKEADRLGVGKPSSLVLANEMPGLLTWALEGAARALKRGFIAMTDEMIEATEEIRKDSNLVAGFMEDCITYDMDRKISSPDFSLAFADWWLQNKGENRGVPSNDSIGKSLTAMADPMIAVSSTELRDARRRYYCGIVLNETGLAHHKAGYESRILEGKTANTTDPKGQVNTQISTEWLQKGVIKGMQHRQLRGVSEAVRTAADRRAPRMTLPPQMTLTKQVSSEGVIVSQVVEDLSIPVF